MSSGTYIWLFVGHGCSRNPFFSGGIPFVCKPCFETLAEQCVVITCGMLMVCCVFATRFVYWSPNQARRVASVIWFGIMWNILRAVFCRTCGWTLRTYVSVNSPVCLPASLLTLITDLPVMSSIVDAKTGSACGRNKVDIWCPIYSNVYCNLHGSWWAFRARRAYMPQTKQN